MIAAAVLLVACGGQAHADMVFSTLGPGDSYNHGAGYNIGYYGVYLQQGNRFSFTGPQAYNLDTIELPVGWIAGTNQLDVLLMTDAGGELGSVIESFSFVNVAYWSTDSPLLVGTSILHPLLAPDTNYWLVASAPDNTMWMAWDLSDPAVMGWAGTKYSSVGWQSGDGYVLNAFRISGEPAVVPLPGAVLLGAIGLSFASWRLRRNTE